MKINSINSNINFKGTYLVASNNKQLCEIKKELDKMPQYYQHYGLKSINNKNSNVQDWFEKAQKSGRDVNVFITGNDDCINIFMNKSGWQSVKEIAANTKTCFDVNDENIDSVISILKKDMY